jgi:diguanylate cyclase (GGDEF)-like protein
MSPNSVNQKLMLEKTFERTPLAALFIDITSNIIIKANKAAINLYGGALEGENVNRINFHSEQTYVDLRKKVLNKKISVIQTKHITFSKKIIDVECHINVINQQGRKFFYSLIRDVSHELAYKEKLLNEASIDELTGIPNRRFFTTVIQGYLENLKRYNEKFALIYFDIDNFKYYNDQYGHAFGDEIIRSTIKIINKEKRASDFLARLSGDEFILILNRVLNQNDLAKICINLGEIIQKSSMHVNPTVTVSIGASIVQKFDALDKIISRIDRAMYISKKRGGNTFQISTLESDKNVSELLYHLDGINLVNQKKFAVSYQPIIDLKNNSIHKVEVFLRLKSKLLQNFSVEEVVRDAINHQAISSITFFVLNQACQDFTSYIKHVMPDLKLGINITLHELISDFNILQNNLTNTLEKYGMSSKNFVLEINEFSSRSVESKDLVIAYKNINHLKKLGFYIAIDDFGSGYSNLPYFQEIDIDYLKIDKIYLNKILSHEKKSLLIYESIVDLCKKFAVNIIAEGVECVEQVNYIKRLDVQYAQGYLYFKSLTLGELMRKLNVQMKKKSVN